MAKRTGRQSSSINKARALGRTLAARTLERRASQRRKRRAVRSVRGRALAAGRAEIPAQTLRALALPPPTGLLVAEGDSWFDYPFNDVLSMLEDEHGFDVESVAHKGDRVEDMAYSRGQFDDFTRLLEKLLRQGRVPDAILLSGGGNDLAGDEFAMLLNHAASGLPALNDDIVQGVIDVRTEKCVRLPDQRPHRDRQALLDRPIPVILHGYDYPVPDGRGFLGGFGICQGPGCGPDSTARATATSRQHESRRRLIDAFNAMLRQLARAEGFEHVRYVDLRGTLSNAAAYKRDWANELHPTEPGFKAVALKIASAI